MIRQNLEKNKGFALLFAVLLSSLLLAIGLSIFNISLKEVQISTAGRESQYAFYAADSGLECAQYWDATSTAVSLFATSSSSILNSGIGMTCGGRRIDTYSFDENNPYSVASNGWLLNAVTDSATTTFSFPLLSSVPTIDVGQPCVEVVVSKTTIGGSTYTTISSRGRNICDVEGRRTERGLRMSY